MTLDLNGTLNDLLDAELNSVFAFLGDSTPYLDRAHAAMHKPLEEMVRSSRRRAERLCELIESVGGSPIPRGLQPAEQNMAYLSFVFLLPRLIEAKQRDIERYQQVRRSLIGGGAAGAGEVAEWLDKMIAEQTTELATLRP